ncbi:GNAT family N-acetyltransferase [Bdellovibrio bacteriovorus]|uniref:GNAT family N-acetyltransferase n=1 Tax=Bdellovibrio bacteriovorus TaxID=959 RepID=UPI0021CE0A69|nr:GNAT family N-acetyltransferase [Bdellovibrio bacteriovorus]UXR66258.1 GNAT family N-acetyltransferase [Bdellovibrio bacteriovorus]
MVETSRLIIKKWTVDMAGDFLELSHDEGFTLYPITDYRQADIESARVWIQKNTGKYAVIEKSSGCVIGMGGLTPWHWEGEDLVDLTYRFKASAQGKGYGTELARALIAYGFTTLNLTQITATITTDNITSKKLAEKLGMKFDRQIVLLNIPTDMYRLYK